MARQSKSLAAHVRDGTFRPSAHLHLLVSGADLPVKTPDPNPTPAMTRLTARLRELQVEARDVRSAEVRYDLAREFGRVAGDYVKARDHAPPDDEDVVAGLRELRAAFRSGKMREGHSAANQRAHGRRTGYAIRLSLPPRDDRDLAAPLFPGTNANALRTAIAKACRATGTPLWSPHDLRHRRISLLRSQASRGRPSARSSGSGR